MEALQTKYYTITQESWNILVNNTVYVSKGQPLV